MSHADETDEPRAPSHAESGAPVPRPRPGYRTPEPSWSQTMSQWSPVVAAMLRGITGLVAFLGSLLAMPLVHATPLLVGVSLVMIVGGATATLKATRDDVRLRGVGRGFTIVVCVVVLIGLGVAAVVGPGAFAPALSDPAPTTPHDGSVRFETY